MALLGRTPQARRRYFRHKLIAMVVTFVVVYAAVKLFVPRETIQEGLEAIVLRTPAQAFEQRATGELVHAVAVVEAALPDTTIDAVSHRRWRARSIAGHPFVVFHAAGGSFAAGDSIVVRGGYRFDPQGGSLHTQGSGPHSDGGERPGFLRRLGERSAGGGN